MDYDHSRIIGDFLNYSLNTIRAKKYYNLVKTDATHDPLVINGVPKEFIRIFTHNENLVSNNGYYFTKVIVPTEDTEGMGIDGLLQSEYYGLSSVLDSETKDKMDEKHRLLIKKKDGTITDNEKYKLLD